MDHRRRLAPLGLLAAALLWGACTSESFEPGQGVAQVSQPIVNGTPEPQTVTLTDGQMLAIGWLHPAGSPADVFCSGTLIAPQYVATARHCVFGSSPGQIEFGIGPSASSSEASFSLRAIYSHQGVDAAILELSEDATAAVEGLTPIPANREAPTSDDIGREMDAAGYGTTRGTNPEGRWFAKVYLDDVDSDLVYVDGRGEQGICNGDSGGPVLWESSEGEVVVVGVESGGADSCVDVDWLTRLDAIMDDFIDPIMAGDPPEDPCAGMPAEGRCDGSVAEFCGHGQQLIQWDCAALGTECAFIEEGGFYGCTCGDDLDFRGRCDGDVVEYCDDGSYRQINCAGMGGNCSFIDAEIGYFCTEDEPICAPDTENGLCEGDTLVTCSSGRTSRFDCAGDACLEDATGAASCGPVDAPVDDPDVNPFPDLPDAGGDVAAGGGGTSPDDGCQTVPGTAPSPLWLLAVVALFWRRRER